MPLIRINCPEDALTAEQKAKLATVLGDDGTSTDFGGQHIAPAYMKGFYCLFIEIPEGSWGSYGHTLSAMDIAKIAGTDQNLARFKELQENTAKLKAARVS